MPMDKKDEVAAAPDVEDVEVAKTHAHRELIDDEVAKYAADAAIEIDPETNKRLKRMIDKRVLAVMVVTYLVQSLDKGTMSYASIMGIITDTNLQGQEYSWLTTIIYLVILCVEYPENYIIQRVPIAKWLALNITLWGVTLCMHAACNNFTGLIVVRGFLGAFEAVCQPAFVLLSSIWYKREEQATTVILWYMMNGLQQLIGGLIAFAFSFVPASSPIKSWQALFMTYGIMTAFWGVFVFWWMPDSPMKAKCFSEEDKRLMVERVRENRTGLQNKKFRKEQLLEVFRDPQVYGFALIQLFTTLPSGGLGAFANIIIKSFGFAVWETQLLQSVSGIIQLITMLTAIWVDRRYKQTILAMMAALLPTIAGTVVLMAEPFEYSKRVGLLIAYYIMISFWACSGLALSLVTRNVAGSTKKSVVIATNFVCWAVGNSIGPQVFRAQDAPRYFLALAIIVGCFTLLEFVLFALRTWYVTQNRKRDHMVESGEVAFDSAQVTAFEDVTDRQNMNFRYIY